MKKDLHSVPLEKLLVPDDKRLEVIEELNIKSNSDWLMPQISAYLANMPLVRNSEGKIDPDTFRDQNFTKDNWHKGLWFLLKHPKRSDILKETQYTSAYAPLVPLVLMPFKKFHNIAYSEWDRERVHILMYPELAEAVQFSAEISHSREELLEIRHRGLEIKSGKNEGTYRNPLSTFKLYQLKGTDLEKAPWLVQVMCTQIWCAHPQNRTQYMVLDWVNLDQMPEPLIPTELL